MAESSASGAKDDLLNQGEELLQFLFYNQPVCQDIESVDDDFDLFDNEDHWLSDYPSELDFYDQKGGQICRRNGGKKISNAVKAKKNCLRNSQAALPSSKTICNKTGDSEFCSTTSNKELRIKDTRTENANRKKENKRKAKKVKGITTRTEVQSESQKKPHASCLRTSVKKKSPESVNQTTNPLSFYNNSDFVLGSGNTVKFEDQPLVNLLIELQDREIAPEDYDLLVQLDCSVKPKIISDAKINSLRSDSVTSVLDDVCSICMEDYIPGDVRKFLPCEHHFHGHCIRIWLSTTSDRCPIDGKEVR